MTKKHDEDRCWLYEKHGSRHTRCTQVSEMSYRVIDELGEVNPKKKGEPYDVRICFNHLKYEPKDLDAICIQTVKLMPKEEEAPA